MSIQKIAIDVLLGVGITVVTLLIFKQGLTRITRRTKTDFDDFVLKTLSQSIIPLGVVLTFYLIKEDLSLNKEVQEGYEIVLRVMFTLVIVRFFNRISIRFLKGLARRTGDDDLMLLAEAVCSA